MPPRSEEELDAVTLHNQALMNMEANPTQGFEKLQFLLQQNPFPPETFGNLLLLYIKYEVRQTLFKFQPLTLSNCQKYYRSRPQFQAELQLTLFQVFGLIIFHLTF